MENFEETKQEENLSLQPSSKRKYILIAAITAVVVGAGILILFTQKETPSEIVESQVTEEEAEVNQEYPNPCKSGQAPVYEGGEFSNCVNLIDPSSDNIADWQTYTSEEFGFEVKYPGDWFDITNQEANERDVYGGGWKAIAFSNQNKDLDLRDQEMIAFILQTALAATEQLEFFQSLQQLNAGESLTRDSVIVKKVADEVISDLPGIRFMYDYSTEDPTIITHISDEGEQVMVLEGDRIFVFALFGNSAESLKQGELTYNQILSTFRFIE